MPRNELDYFLNRVHQAYVDARKPLCADELCELTIERDEAGRFQALQRTILPSCSIKK